MTLFLDDGDVRLYHGDALEQLILLPDGCVDMVATSPPFYGLRDYGTGEWEGGDETCDHIIGTDRQDAGRRSDTFNGGHSTSDRYAGRECPKCGARRVDRQIGLEQTPQQWVDNLVAVFRECRRVLADHGTLWVEIGDSAGGGGFSPDSPVNVKRREQIANGEHMDGVFGLGASQHTRNIKGRVKATPDIKAKDLLGQPWMLAFALRADGWYLRSEIIWARPNPMPESVTDRPTKAHSTVFLLSKQPRYFYDLDAIREPVSPNWGISGPPNVAEWGDHIKTEGRSKQRRLHHDTPMGANARSVWQIPTEPTPFAHFATWPRKLVARMIQAGCREGGTVLDPFAGSGTTLLVARYHGRHAIGIELNPDYCKLAADRLSQLSLLTGDAA